MVGEWNVFEYDGGLHVDGVGRQTICRISANRDEKTNARLIAAAPDLLDALEKLLPRADGFSFMREEVEKAKQAIAKARTC